jgi:hypothetical protein
MLATHAEKDDGKHGTSKRILNPDLNTRFGGFFSHNPTKMIG